ncbi:probable E3 ubiquitin-protein ligase RNF144A-B [Herrania umbratica]|uniref:RBR-type E3 ubiquitin transferase n=1 Tax=Herrania umbratica TaxID=108875 RepID=A0A6J1B5E4_9ROSI|nr:probable E3 ubiquitin-protein ligase RNF144A-B [Herrania umbratica]
MGTSSSDFDFAEAIYLSEVLYGNGGGDLQQLDAKFAEQLQFQDAIFFSVKKTGSSSTSRPMNFQATSSMRKPKPRESATNAGDSPLSYCEICVERKERRQMFPVSGCSHSFCSDCISMHVKTRLKENITIIMCPGENCGVILELPACGPLLPREVVNLWEDLLCEELLCATGGRLYCPFKDCSALLLNDNQEEVIADCECPFCHRLFCAQCHVPWHPGIDCEEYQKLAEDERGREDLMVRKLVKENKWRRCPSCHIIVERTEGCPHMTCRCKFEFCYACGAEWTQDHGGCQNN